MTGSNYKINLSQKVLIDHIEIWKNNKLQKKVLKADILNGHTSKAVYRYVDICKFLLNTKDYGFILKPKQKYNLRVYVKSNNNLEGIILWISYH